MRRQHPSVVFVNSYYNLKKKICVYTVRLFFDIKLVLKRGGNSSSIGLLWRRTK